MPADPGGVEGGEEQHFSDHDFFDDGDIGLNDTVIDAGESDANSADENVVVGSAVAPEGSDVIDNDVRPSSSHDAPTTPSDDEAVVRREGRRRRDRLADLVSSPTPLPIWLHHLQMALLIPDDSLLLL